MESSLNIAIGAMITGVVVGVLTGIFGVGGGFLMTPALMIFLNIPGPVAVGTGLAVILANSSLAMLKRRHSGAIDVKLGLTIATGGIFGVLAGSYFLELLEDAPKLIILGKEQETVQYCLLCMFLVLLVWIAGYMLFDDKHDGGGTIDKRTGFLSAIKIPPYFYFPSLRKSRVSVVMLLTLGFCIGVLTGLMGIGGAVLLLPALVYLVGQQTDKAVATSLVFIWLSSLAAVIRKSGVGHISLLLLLFLVIGGMAGTLLGIKIGLKLPGSKIRLYFVYVVIATILMIGYKLGVMTF